MYDLNSHFVSGDEISEEKGIKNEFYSESCTEHSPVLKPIDLTAHYRLIIREISNLSSLIWFRECLKCVESGEESAYDSRDTP